MNTGAFGEGFPYSNFHDLNTDWIIKIAKDFLDQYTHIQEVIANGEESLENLTTSGLEQLQEKADALEALLQEWYNEHSEDIADQLADALSDLNDWYTQHSDYLDETLQENIDSFDSYATQKGAEVIESIPDDYTALSNEVVKLSSDYSQTQTFRESITGINWILGKYVITEGASIGQLGNNADYSASEPIKLLPYAHYKIVMGTDTRWCSYDENNTPIMASKESFEFIATENWDYLRVSTTNTDKPSFKIYVTYNYNIANGVSNVLGVFNKIIPIQKWISGYYVWANDGTVWANSEWSCTNFLSVIPNSIIFIDHDDYQGAIYNNNGAWISGFKTTTDHFLLIPSTGYYIKFSCPTSSINNNCLKMNIRNFTQYAIDKVTSDRFYNLADGGYISAFSGVLTANANMAYSDYIPVKPNTLYEIFPTGSHVAYYDEGFNYVGGNGDGSRVCKVFETTSQTYYIRASVTTEQKQYFKIKENVTAIHVYPQSTSPENFYSILNYAFLDSHITKLPIYIHGGTWDVTDLSTGYGLAAVTDVHGVGNPRIIAHPESYNDDFSVLNLTGAVDYPSLRNTIIIEGLILEGSNLRYCLHMEMGGNYAVDINKSGYSHIIKNCTFVGGNNIRRDVGVGMGDNGFVMFENCVFDNTSSSYANDQLGIHSGFNGQRAKATAIVKDCLFVKGTCSFNEVGEYQYSGFKNTFIAENNSVTSMPTAGYTTHGQNDFYSWNNVVRN